MAQSQRAPAPPSNDAPLKQKKKLLNGPHFTFTYPNGSVYEGAFKDGKLHGFGTYKYLPSGDFYEGEWKADMKHGHGTYSFAGGDTYTGSWYMGKKHGKGKFSFTSGDAYYGSWKEDVMDGYGVFSLERNGDQYEGFWEHGLRQGLGVFRAGSGNIYDGEWASGKEEGFGVSQDVNGALYCGTWKAGLKDGKGVEQDKGMTFLVDYLGGYLISKQPNTSARDGNDSEWDEALHRLSEWAPPPPLTLQPSGFAEKLDSDAVEAVKRTLDSWRSAYLALFNHVCQQQAQQQQAAVLPPADRIVVDTKRHAELLKGRIQLLEAALGEKMLEGRRVQESIREKDAALQDLKVQVAHLRSSRARTALHNQDCAAGMVGDKRNDGVGTEDASLRSAAVDMTLLADLRKQNISLTQVNYTQQQRLVVLAAENAKVSAELAVLEDTVRDLEEKLKTAVANVNTVPCDDAAVPKTGSPDEMSESEARKRLRQANQSNAELLVRISHLEETLKDAQLEIGVLKKRVKDATESEAVARQEAARINNSAKAAAAEQEKAFEPALLPDWRADTERGVTDSRLIVNDTLLEKEKRIAQLEKENADLSRLMEEYRFQLDEPTDNTAARSSTSAKKTKKERPQESPEANNKKHKTDSNGWEELEKAETDLKKSRKKLKKMLEERNDLALDLYNTQCNLARLNRTPLLLRGQIVVAVALESATPTNDAGKIVRVNDADPTQIEVTGVPKNFKFDACFAHPASPEHVFMEVRSSLVFAAHGFQAGFVGLGGCRSRGSHNTLADLLPFLVEGLRSENTVHEQYGKGRYSVSYRVAAVKIDSSGSRDCFSGKQLTKVVKDDHGYVKPSGVSFADCGGERLLDVLKQPLANHTKSGALSHLWVQVQVTVTHRMDQTARCGRLTLLDLGGLSASDEFDEFDAQSARYMKRSLRQVDDLLFALQTDADTVPYAASMETSLLYDLIGGNSMTTVVGCVPESSVEQKDQVLAGLTTLESFAKLQNGPFLQDFVSSDQLRWREIVSAVSSADQALPDALPVANIAR